MRENTRIVHGEGSDEVTGCISKPLYRGVNYRHKHFQHEKGDFAYARCGTPTTAALEDNIALLEGGKRGFATSSGMGAISVVFKLFKPGDHIIVTYDLYGGTYRYLHNYLALYGYEFDYVDTSDIEKVKEVIRPNTKAFFIETPSNPCMHVTDLRAISEIAKSISALVIVDNTLLSPYFQKPIVLGADIVVHSATKYLGGHNDILAGLIVAATEELGDRLFEIFMAEGNNLGSDEAWLLMRSMKTLGIRMERHQKNALEISKFLKQQSFVKKVFYVGDKDHPEYELSLKQTTGFGGLISFEVIDEYVSRIPEILSNFKLITFAESLGGVESLVTYPIVSTQGPIPEEQRLKAGTTKSLIRLSVGIEDVEDLEEDILSAFSL